MRLETSEAYWSEVQTRLAAHGFDPGAIDGQRGERTDGALIRFKASRGLRRRAYVGLGTEAALMDEPQLTTDGEAPRWMEVAGRYLGLREMVGARHNPQILSWWLDIDSGWFKDDETPWCGAFVGGVLAEAGLSVPSRDGARARAWEDWGQGLDEPAVGAVVTFFRGGRESGSGHVAFVAGRGRGGRIACLGGNQSDAVSVAEYEEQRGSSWGVTSYRWPDGEPLPERRGMDALPPMSAVAGGQVT